MQRILRGLEGLPPGTVLVLGRRAVLGRAPDSDLQLVDPEVSRRHAKIEVDDDEQVVVVDLASKGGTFVDGTRVDRSTLHSGSTIEIGPFCLRYEEIDAAATEHKPNKRSGMDALRQTVQFDFGLGERDPRVVATGVRADDTSRIVIEERVVSTPGSRVAATPPLPPRAPAKPPTGARVQIVPPPLKSDLATRRTVERPSVRDPVDVEFAGASARPRPALKWTPSGGVGGVTGETPMAPSDPPATDEAVVTIELGPETLDGTAARDIIRDVFEYRELRLRVLRGEPIGADLDARLRALDQRLQLSSVGNDPLVGTRRFRRFQCPLPAWLGRRTPGSGRVTTSVVELEDLGAGGAQVIARGSEASVGESCWLAIDLETGDAVSVLVFRARVVWRLAETNRVGLVFSGAGSCGTDPLELIAADTA